MNYEVISDVVGIAGIVIFNLILIHTMGSYNENIVTVYSFGLALLGAYYLTDLNKKCKENKWLK